MSAFRPEPDLASDRLNVRPVPKADITETSGVGPLGPTPDIRIGHRIWLATRLEIADYAHGMTLVACITEQW